MIGSGEHNSYHFLVSQMCILILLHLISAKKRPLFPVTMCKKLHSSSFKKQLVCICSKYAPFGCLMILPMDSDMYSLRLIHTNLKLDNIALKHLGRVFLHYPDPVWVFQTYVGHSHFMFNLHMLTHFLWQHQLMLTQICIHNWRGVVKESKGSSEGSVGAMGYYTSEISLGICRWYTNSELMLMCQTQGCYSTIL